VVTYQDFRDANDGSSLINFQNNVTVQAVPVPSRVNLQSSQRTSITIADKYLITASFEEMELQGLQEANRWALL
jgi:iron complex outermembrane receptor protein